MSSILVAVVLLAVAVIAEAQQPKKVSRIGYLSNTGDAATESARSEAIRLALRELGYIEGQNIAIEYRYAEGKPDRAPELAAELVRLKVDIIVVAEGTRGSGRPRMRPRRFPSSWRALGPILLEAGIVESLARPGGNVTGTHSPYQGTRREAAGAAQRSRSQTCPCRGSLRSGRSAQFAGEVKEDLPVAARALGLTIQPWEVRAGGRFREGICCAKQAAPGWTLRAGGPANVC